MHNMAARRANSRWENHMARFSAIRIPSISKTPERAPGKAIHTALAATMLASAAPGFAADVTPERLLNPDPEPQIWLMNRRTYDGQRFWWTKSCWPGTNIWPPKTAS
jgi:hypothetical protein